MKVPPLICVEYYVRYDICNAISNTISVTVKILLLKSSLYLILCQYFFFFFGEVPDKFCFISLLFLEEIYKILFGLKNIAVFWNIFFY